MINQNFHFHQYAESSDALKCKVCGGAYEVEKGSEFSLSKGFTAKQVCHLRSLMDYKYHSFQYRA